MNKSICIVGCGVAGLSALRVFSEEIKGYPIDYEIFAYEQSSKLGGLWNYNESVNAFPNSAIYRDLRTNIPKELMFYPDLLYSSDIEDSFIKHKEVLNYITTYAKHYDLEKFIQFNSEVINIDPQTEKGDVKWNVRIKNTVSDEIFLKSFDAILLCNGHFEIPKIPSIPGMEHFVGEFIHSQHYKFPEKYADKIVFVVGAKSSGLDVALQLMDVAKTIYLSHNGDPILSQITKENFKETPIISHIDEKGIICLVDGSQYKANIIIFCTGYEINLNVLTESVGLKFDNTFVRPLYKDLIHPYFPSSFFIIGLAYEFLPFIHCFMQSKVARSIVQNCHKNIDLSTETLVQLFELEQKQFDLDGISLRHRHFYSEKEWLYFNWCQQVSQNLMTIEIPKFCRPMFQLVKKWRQKNVDKYREIRLKLADNQKLGFVIIDGPEDDFYTMDYENCLKSWEND